MKLFEREPAASFDNAHLLGNGRLGASIYGGVPTEEILINDDTLWSGSETYTVNPEFYERLMEVRALVLSGDVKAANDVINDHMEGCWGQAYMPLGSLLICVGQKDARRHMRFCRVLEPENSYPVTDYRRELDLDRAVATVAYTRDGVAYKRECFVSHDRQLIYVRLSAENGTLDFGMTLTSLLKHQVTIKDNEITLKGIAPDHAEPNYTPVQPALIYRDEATSDALRFAACCQVVETDGAVWCDENRVYVNDARYAVLAIAAGTNYAGYMQPRNKDAAAIVARLDAQLNQAGNWDAALREHLRDYQALYNRFTLDLGEEITGEQPTSARLQMNGTGMFDPSVSALAVQYARYLLIAGSRPGSQAENLQGIWNDRVQPPWSSNYTTNINVEMNYWPAEQFALSECHEPLIDFVRECADSGRRVARDYYHLDGWVAHHNVDLWRSCIPACEDASWAFWPFGGAWLAQHVWAHYEYTLDKDYLRDVAYPILREAARFMLGYLCEDGERLTTAPSTSPENKFIVPGGRTYRDMVASVRPDNRFPADQKEICAVAKGSCMEMSMIRELFGNTLASAEKLGIADDDLNAAMRAALPRLSPFKIGKNGTLQEWFDDYEECTPGMGHVSHLYSVYPAAVINERDYPAEYRAAYLSLQRRVAHGGMTQAWPGSWALCLAARFHDRTLATRQAACATGGMNANMLMGRHIQIDAIFGYAAGIGEMLLQSHNGYIELLPTPAYGWVNGSFSGMRARGGFQCDLKWQDDAPCGGSIISHKGGKCAVKAKGLKGVILPDGSAVAPDADGVVRFETEAGAAYTLDF